MRSLTFAALLRADGRFELAPGFVVDGEPVAGDGDLEVMESVAPIKGGKVRIYVTKD